MDDISCLENLESLLTSKFKDHLSFRISETGSKPFLIISQFKPTDLCYVPSFHLVATPLHDESLFMLKLLSFHGKVLVRMFVRNDTSFSIVFNKLILKRERCLPTGQFWTFFTPPHPSLGCLVKRL